MSLTKGLPLAYNKDLQLDKEPVFRLAQTTTLILQALIELVETLDFDRERMAQRASSESLTATARADALAKAGVPFRAAHEEVSRTIGGPHPAFGHPLPQAGEGDLLKILERHSAFGGTSPSAVKEAAASALARIQKKKETLL
jgi:argininosuccinate lyase